MNAAHVHLLLNHVPVLGTVFALLLLGYALWRRQEDVMRVGLGFLVLTALAAVVVYLTGEPAEELVEGMAGISETALEAHEEAAVFALAASGLLGGLALAGLVRFRRELPHWVAATALVLALAVTGVMAWTANLGGQINHPELTTTPAAGEQATRDATHAEEDD